MLKVKNLKASIGEVEILKGIDLEIGDGELHAVMGPNGSGKSTLCHVLMGNTDYKNEGAVTLNGEDVLSLAVQMPGISSSWNVTEGKLELTGENGEPALITDPKKNVSTHIIELAKSSNLDLNITSMDLYSI